MTKSYLTQTQRNTLAWRLMPRYAGGTCPEKKKREQLGLKYKKMYWLIGRRSACRYVHNKPMLYKYWRLCGPTAYSCGHARNRATMTSFNDTKTRYLGTSLMQLGISETPTSTGTFKCRWLRMKLESPPRSAKEGFLTTSTSKRSSCSTTEISAKA